MIERLTLQALSMTLPVLQDRHPNKAPFRGVLTRVDEPSTRPPTNAKGHRVFLPRAVAEAALPSLQGMPVDCTALMRQHDKQQIVGIIDEGHLEGNDLVVDGYLLEVNQPELVATIREQQATLGMSYEMDEVGVDDLDATIWTLNHCMFTGAAILAKNAAAYQHTAIAAEAEEGALMPAVDTILQELRTLRRDVGDIAAARKDDEDEEAARKDEDAAEAAIEEAAKAREDEDEEEATRHEAQAATLRANAIKRRDEAATRHRLEATKRTEAEDAEGATAHLEAAAHHEAEAKRLREEDAKQTSARQHALEAKDAGKATLPNAMQAMLETMGYVPKASLSANMDEDMMEKLFGMFLKAMVYPGGTFRGKRRSAEAAHDDEAEDRALFRRLLEQHRTKEALDASGKDDLATRRMDRRLQHVEAAMELITDTLKQQTGLLTDLVHKSRNLATDALRPGQGGPTRRTMQATGSERWLSQLEGGGQEDAAKGKQFTIAEIDAAMEDENLSVREQIAKKLRLSWSGNIKDN